VQKTAALFGGVDAGHGCRQPRLACGFQQVESSQYVGMDKFGRAGDASVHVGFGGKMHNRIYELAGKYFPDQLCVDNIASDEAVARVFFHAGEICRVAGIGEFVEVNYALACVKF